MTKLVITKAQKKLIEREAEVDFPRECCGLLIGRGEQTVVVADVVPTQNYADSEDRFLIDPQVQFDWIRKLRGSDLQLIGHYHSHPNGRRGPSAHDAAMAMDAGQIWLIASMDDSRVGEIQAFVNGPDTGVLLPISIQIK